jgi:hypothetical protein
MSEFKRYFGVPSGSRVEVDLSPCDGKFVSKAKLISATDVLTWDPCQAPPPPHTLQSGQNYFVSVRLAFIASTTVDVEIRVRTSSGVHSTPWTWTIQGKNGQVALVGGFIQVA